MSNLIPRVDCDTITDIDDLNGMLPDEIVAVVDALRANLAAARQQIASQQHAYTLLVEYAERREQELRAQLDDALETLHPFVDVSLPGNDATSSRPKTVTVREGDLCQAWQVVTLGRRWRPESASAEPSAGQPPQTGDQ